MSGRLLGGRPDHARPARGVSPAALAIALLAAMMAALTPVAGPIPQRSPERTPQSLRISTRTDRSRLRIGENLVYTLVISGATAALPQPALPPLKGFKGAGQYITPEAGGSALAYHYLLAPTEAGRLFVPDFDLRISGQTYRVPGFSADVETGMPLSAGTPAGRDALAAGAMGKDVILQGNLSDAHVYQGEPVVYTLRLLTRRSIRGVDVSPDFPGFQRVEDPMATQSATRQTTRDSKVYLDVVVRRMALFPLQAGKLAIGPFTAELRVEASGSGTAARATVQGGQASVTVLPLPPAPAGFKGAVGSFSLSALAPVPARADTGQPFALALRIGGSGFLPEDPLEGQTTPFFATYPATSQDESGFDGEDYVTRRTVRIPVLPKVAGDVVLPPMKLVYFDPHAKAFKTLEAGGGKLQVSGAATAVRHDVTMAELIRLPKGGRSPGVPLTASLFWTLLLAPFAASAVLITGTWLYRAFSVAPEKARARALGRQASKSLALARRHLEVRKADEFHDALSRALCALLDLQVGRATGGLNLEQLRSALRETSLKAERQTAILVLRQEIETARYAPNKASRKEMEGRCEAVEALAKWEQNG